MPASSLPSLASAEHALCPVCGGTSVRITTSIEVSYDVVFEASAHDFLVIDEVLGDAMWDGGTAVSCPHCHWHGTVGQLRARQDPLPLRS